MESTVMLSGSSQGESSVSRVRLRVVKTHYECTLAHYEYALAEVEYTSLPPSAFS